MDPFDGRPHEPEEQFRLYFYAAVLLVRDRVVGAAELAPDHFLTGYLAELPPAQQITDWLDRLTAWERTGTRLPLTALRERLGLTTMAIAELFMLGLPDEDPRFGTLFQQAAGYRRDDPQDRARGRRELAILIDAGVVTAEGRPDPVVWDVISRNHIAAWAGYRPLDQLPSVDQLILTDAVRERALAIPELGANSIVVRGPRASGRGTILRAIAREIGRGVLDLAGLPAADESRRRCVGALAILLDAMPILTMDPAPGQTAEPPALPGYPGPVGYRMPDRGGLGVADAVTLTTDVPDAAARRRHWLAAFDGRQADDIDALATNHRLTGGTIRRIARVAAAESTAAGRSKVTATDVVAASRTVHAELLDTLATRLPTAGGWDDLVVGAHTREELLLLERRCRNRERLPGLLPPTFGGFGVGVRAMFTGPSGTGKSLSARLLGGALGKDVYRLNLSGVVDKYLGETEKNLERVLGAAETLDAVLLIDEGDALLTKRTDVHSSNDRYANLETNYLLQRLESFDGILVVTTNAEQRVDEAFERRFDMVVDFTAPGPTERLAIWQRHLPADHGVAQAFLGEAAGRCALTGGQIRNAVLHAALLADGARLSTGHVDLAVRREYRKSGGVCPLRTEVRTDA